MRKSLLLTSLWIDTFLTYQERSLREMTSCDTIRRYVWSVLVRSLVFFTLTIPLSQSCKVWLCPLTLVFLSVTFCTVWNVSKWGIENMGWEVQWGRLLWRWAWEMCPESFVPRCTETAAVVHRGQLCCIPITVMDDGPHRDTWEVLVSHVVSVKRQVICSRLCPKGCLWENKHAFKRMYSRSEISRLCCCFPRCF